MREVPCAMFRCVCKWKRGKETVSCADAGYRDIPHVSGAGTQVARLPDFM